ncbi:MAG: hypothetical protein U0R49_04730 [Fimbriimonadales bacterium]
MPDPIPPGDAEFDTFQNNVFTYINANLVALGLTALDADVVLLGTQHTSWGTDYPAHVAAQGTAQSARATKDATRLLLQNTIRRLFNRLQVSSAVSDAERAALGMTIRDTTRTPVEAPTTRPVLQGDTSDRLRVIISFADEGTPTSRAKPTGVAGCELWSKIGGAPPTDLGECDFLALDTRTPYVAEFDGSQANQTVHIIGVWVSSRGDRGPLSETLSVTIPG